MAPTVVTPAGSQVPTSETTSPAPTHAIQLTEDAQAVEDVIVVAERPAVLNQIDRRIYDIGRDPAAQTSSLLEILEKVPSVSVSPSGRLQLLGQANVTVLIDGQRPANQDAILRTLTGANVDRIEVMTNPGVQYGPVGTGGIINIITRQRTAPGVTGTLAATVDTYGAASLTAAPSLTRGRWTLSSSLGLSAQDVPDRSAVVREAFAGPDGPALLTEETRTGRSETQGATASVKLSYRLSDSQRLTGGIELSHNRQDQDRRARTISLDAPSTDHLDTNPTVARYDTAALSAGYTRTGPRDGEELTLAARLDEFNGGSRSLFDSDYAGSASDLRFRTTDRPEYDTQSTRLDYKRPLAEGRIITAGMSWERNGQTSDLDVDILQGAVGAISRHLETARNVTAGYGTIQVDWAGLRILPGVRIEYQDLSVASTSAVGGNSGVDVYPSLFISRPLGEGLKLNLSYSARINRPDGWLLDPTVSYSRPLEAFRGNPSLRPETIDSLELKLDWTRPRWSLNLTLYDKERHDLWSQARERFASGLIVTTFVNSGNGADRGLELSARGKLGDRFSYVTTTNLSASTEPVLEGGVTKPRTALVYSGNAQLEYALPARDGLEADKVQLAINYNGPQQDLQTTSEAYFSANLTWRHPLSNRTTAVLLLRNVFNNGGYVLRTETDEFSDISRSESRGVTVRFGLTYRLGDLP